MRRFRHSAFVRVGFLMLLFFAFERKSRAYVLEGTRWGNGVVTFNLGLGAAGRTLLDGNTSWDVAAQPAFAAWNSVMRNVQISGVVGGSSTAFQGDGVNSITFATQTFGGSFGSGTLAVTYRYWVGSSTMTGADILFNRNQAFDSYRGGLRFGSDRYSIGDIRRVLIHELGHALGLDHPDQHNQTVDAIMNSVTSDREVPSADDIAGVQAMYQAPPSIPPTPTPVPTPVPTATPAPPVSSGPSHFANLSTRMNVGVGSKVAIAGFVVDGTQSKKVMVRALGASLGSLGVANSISDPTLELHDSSGSLLATNDDWETGSQTAEISSTGLAPQNGNESALIATLPAGAYTAIVQGYNGAVGVGLVEVYELDSNTTRLKNISTRGEVGLAENILIGGVVVSGTGSKNVLVRALGPSLAQPPYSVTGVLANPALELRDASGNLVASNDDWAAGSQVAAISATGFAPGFGSEAAITATLPSGNYTALVRGSGNSTGVALMDVFDLDP